MATRRIPSACRLLTRRKLYLAALAGSAMTLTLLLVLLLAFVWLALALLPASWPVAAVGLVTVAFTFVILSSVALAFVGAGLRAYTALAARPLPATPAGLVGGIAGLGLFFLGRRLRARRGLVGWATDPMGSAAGAMARRALPPEHPLVALLEIAGLQSGKLPTRGVGSLVAGVLLVGFLLTGIAFVISPVAGVVALALAVAAVPFAWTLGAALRGLLDGAWDRVLMDQAAVQAEDVMDAAGGLLAGVRVVPEGPA